MFAYIGSFNYTGSEGIHICDYDENTGKLTYRKTVMPEINPGNLCVYKDILLATDESMSCNVHAFRIDRQTGDLTELSCTDTLAVNPSYITITDDKSYALITHFSITSPVRRITKYEDGDIQAEWIGNDSPTCLYRLDDETGLGELLDIGLHRLHKGPLTMVHKAYASPDNSCYAENDLGGNRVYFFRIENGKIHCFASADVDDGTNPGPRHGAFHPEKPYLYINYEHKSRISKLDLTDMETPRITEELELFTDGETLEPSDNHSELLVHPNGTILYDFLRGKGLVYVIEIDKEDGHMTLKQKMTLPGNDPRGAFWSPDQKYILVEGHNTGAVYTLKIEKDGSLSYSGECCEMAHPACIAFCTE